MAEAEASGLRCRTVPPARAGCPPAAAGPAPRGRLPARKGEGEAETGRIGAWPCPARNPGAARPEALLPTPVRTPAASSAHATSSVDVLFHRQPGCSYQHPPPSSFSCLAVPAGSRGDKVLQKRFLQGCGLSVARPDPWDEPSPSNLKYQSLQGSFAQMLSSGEESSEPAWVLPRCCF